MNLTKKNTKPQNPISTIKRILGYAFRGYKLQLIFVAITILISALAGTSGIVFFKILIDNFVVPLMGKTTINYSNLIMALLIMGFIYYLGALCTFIYNRLMINISQGILKEIRDQMFDIMETLPLKYFDTNSTGDLMSRYTNDTDTLRQMISQSIPMILSSIVTVVSSIIAMIILSIPLTLITVAMIVIMVFNIKSIAKKSSHFFGKQQKDIGAINGYIEEMIEGQKVVKVFSYEEKAQEKFNQFNNELCNSSGQANSYANMMMPILNNTGNFTYILTALIGSLLTITGITYISLGTITSFIQLNRAVVQPVIQISQQFNSIIMALAGAERIFDLIDATPESDSGTTELVNSTVNNDGSIVETDNRTGNWAWKSIKDLKKDSFIPLKGDVRFNHVSFGYNDNSMVLHDINIFAKPGQKIALVGSTGAGKTTITNLLTRFYDVQEGDIYYDGINITDIKKADLRHSLGMVLQETHLFTGTIMDNIRYGRLDASDEEVISAAKLANADQFIQYLSDGYNTLITGDGGSLSQGQRQLLSIARAALADPPVLILDEATSGIDTRTESIVQRGMDKLMEGRTVFVIAHRLSTIRNSDAIMVMQNGEIIERGTHEELIKNGELYYQLYTGAVELA